ncbi:MAG: carbohydrate kinase family protein [Candidatus Dependentiae bacterium]|nr:carbohydrate kinase family protein [Candidatus Dependentiae bacterium]
MTRHPRVLTIGSATLDLFIGSTRPSFRELELNQTMLIGLDEGIKYEIEDLIARPGGGATNAARVLRRCGLGVTAFFKTADDQIGRRVAAALHEDGIDMRAAITTAAVTTGLSIIIPAPSGNKTILSFRGANDTIQEQELPLFFMKGMDGIYVAPLAGKTAQCLQKIAQESTINTSTLMVNPSAYQLTEGRTELTKVFEHIDILLLNATEAKLLLRGLVSGGTSIETLPRSNLDANLADRPLSRTFDSLQGKIYGIFDFLNTVHGLGPATVLVTDGSNGIYALDEHGPHFCPSVPTQVVNTVAAGDTFGATFFGAHLLGYDTATALRFGAINSARLLGSPDGIAAVLSIEELKKL